MGGHASVKSGHYPGFRAVAVAREFGHPCSVNLRRLILATLAVFAVIVVSDFLVHSVFLSPLYNNENVWRPEIGPASRMIWIGIGQLLMAALFAWLWARFAIAAGKPGLRRALGFGLLMGLFLQTHTLVLYGSYPTLSARLAVNWFVSGVVQSLAAGVVVFWAYRSPERTAFAPQRFRRRWLIRAAVVVLAVLAGMHLWKGGRDKIHPTAKWMAPFDSKWFVQSPGKAYSVRAVSELQKDGEDSLRFELRGGDMYRDALFRGSYRAEADTQDFPPMNSVRWYAFSMLLPKDFPIEANRLVLVQWHGSDKKSLGEVSRIPSMAFRYVDGKFAITLRHSAERIVRDADAVKSEEVFKTKKFPPGEWNDFVVQVKWSYQEDGFVNVWWNGKQIVQYHGPVGYNDDIGPYFRFGLYRDATDKTYVAYFNQVRLGERAEDVGFDPMKATAFSEN